MCRTGLKFIVKCNNIRLNQLRRPKTFDCTTVITDICKVSIMSISTSASHTTLQYPATENDVGSVRENQALS